MKPLVLAAAAATLAFTAPAGAQVVNGWTEADTLAALETAGLGAPSVSTADPSFPAVQAHTPEGFAVSVVRMACETATITPDTICTGAWVSIAIPTTTADWARTIVDALESHAQNPLGVNGLTAGVEGEATAGGAVMLSAYVVADGGVAPGLLDDHIAGLLLIAEQARDFLLADDPAHADLWAPVE